MEKKKKDMRCKFKMEININYGKIWWEKRNKLNEKKKLKKEPFK